MIEVFKTNVGSPEVAQAIVQRIQRAFPGYTANFDLDDCDRILRVKSTGENVDTCGLSVLLKTVGVQAEVLPDVVQGYTL